MSSTAQQAPGITRIDLQQHDLSAPGREVIQNRVEISPEPPPFKHFHPGEEIIYVLGGELEYRIEGQPPRTVTAGEALMVPAEAVPRGEERRRWRRGGARHVCRREGQAAHHARRISKL
jgi:quercetin dioxygenase-like cupin family protein